jgi:hypothetical protein
LGEYLFILFGESGLTLLLGLAGALGGCALGSNYDRHACDVFFFEEVL